MSSIGPSGKLIPLVLFYLPLLTDNLISWHCDANSVAGLFLNVDLYDVRPIGCTCDYVYF